MKSMCLKAVLLQKKYKYNISLSKNHIVQPTNCQALPGANSWHRRYAGYELIRDYLPLCVMATCHCKDRKGGRPKPVAPTQKELVT